MTQGYPYCGVPPKTDSFGYTVARTGSRRRERLHCGILCILAFILSLCLVSPRAGAAEFGDAVFMAGTVWEDAHDRDWAFLVWQSFEPVLLRGRALALYRKPGGPEDAGVFTLQGVVQTQLDPRAIHSILERSRNLGQDLDLLEHAVDELFETLIPSPSLSLGEKLSYVYRGALEDDDVWSNLIFLSRLNPGVALTLGTAFAGRLDAAETATYEVRACPPGFVDPDAECDSVIGRIVLTAGEPLVLAAPGPARLVPVATPEGHLNLRLRWAMTDDLARQSLLQYGFNLYRVETGYAQTHGFDSEAPDPELWPHLILDDEVTRANRLPILPEAVFTDAQAADPDFEPENFFFTDDNDRFGEGEIFNDGDSFVYFATPRDLLGRDGHSVPSDPIEACFRLPPVAPRNIDVDTDYTFEDNGNGGEERVRFRVRWDPVTAPGGMEVTGYRVYRWTSAEEVAAGEEDPLDPEYDVSGLIPHNPAVDRYEWVDEGGPDDPDGTTYYYSVRAFIENACGELLASGNSAPMWGVLREFRGPGAAGGENVNVEIICIWPEVDPLPPFVWDDAPGVAPDMVDVCFQAFPVMKGVTWVEFGLSVGPSGLEPGAEPHFHYGRHYLPRVLDAFIETEASFPLEMLADGIMPGDDPDMPPSLLLVAHARAAGPGGRVTEWVPLPVETEFGGGKKVFPSFGLGLDPDSLDPRPYGPHCFVHVTRTRWEPRVGPVSLVFEMVEGAYEYKVYRRLGYTGKLTLIAQGLNESGQVTTVIEEDRAMPPHADVVCYYVQQFDEHGNPGPMERAECVEIVGTSLPPTPLLQPVESEGDAIDPEVRLRWVSPGPGAHRFRVWLAERRRPLPDTLGDELSGALPEAGPVTRHDLDPDLLFRYYETGVVGVNFGNNPVFEVAIPVRSGRNYTAFIEAVNPYGDAGDPSNVVEFTWVPPDDGTITWCSPLPWPARAVPDEDPEFVAPLPAVYLGANLRGAVGVRVGEVTFASLSPEPAGTLPFTLEAPVDPAAHLYESEEGETVLPAVLYRVQLPNERFPDVSRDVIQVSPLIESIAHTIEPTPDGEERAFVRDPYVLFQAVDGAFPARQGLHIVDTQRVISGSLYQYFLVRFRPDGEIDRVLPSEPIEIP